MGAMKEYAMDLSIALGQDGDLHDEVLELGDKLIDHGLTIRLAEPEDIGPLVDFLTVEGTRGDFTDATRRFIQEIQPNRDCFFWIAFKHNRAPEDEIAGFCQMHMQTRLGSEGPAAYIDQICGANSNAQDGLNEMACVCAELHLCSTIRGGNRLLRELTHHVINEPRF